MYMGVNFVVMIKHEVVFVVWKSFKVVVWKTKINMKTSLVFIFA